MARSARPRDDRRCGVNGAVLSRSGGWCRLCFGVGQQLDATTPLRNVKLEMCGLLLRWPARRSLTSCTSSSGAAREEHAMQRRDGDGNRMAQRGGEDETSLCVGSNRGATHMVVAA
jgi:hypothetical protein